MKRLIQLLIIITILWTGSQAQTVTDQNSISTVGTAEVLVVPDIATVSLTVKRTNMDLSAAKEEMDANIAQILSVAKKFGVGPADMKTDYIAIKEEYATLQKTGDVTFKNYFTGYSISKTVVIRLRQIGRFDDFLSEVVKAGVTELGDVMFESSELRKYKDEARVKAIRAAREKAAAFAQELGQSIGKAITISERSINSWNNPASNIVVASDGESESDDNRAAFAVGTISIKAQVAVRFVLN